MLLNIILFGLVLSVLIISHEFGHFVAARIAGITVERFAIGFGPPLLKIKVKQTLLLVCLIPLGGYVKLAGDSREECRGTNDEFFSKPIGLRALVVFLGPFFNYVLAFLVFYVILMTGYPVIKPMVGEVLENTPAYSSGVETGDLILKVNGQKVRDWGQVSSFIRESGGSVELIVSREGQEKKISIVPEVKTGSDIFGREKKTSFVGIAPASEFKIVRSNFAVAFIQALKKIGTLTAMILQGLYFTLVGIVPFKEAVTGPIGIYHITAKVAEVGGVALFEFIGVLSVSLGVINLFPLPVLDGGHLLFMGIEKIRRRPLSQKWENILVQTGLALIIIISLLVLYNDILKFGIHK